MNLVLPILALILSSYAVPALAIDCNQARSSCEKYICREPILVEKDGAMSQAYNELKANLKPQQAATLTGQQKDWLQRIQESCKVNKSVRLSILTDLYESRKNELEGAGSDTEQYYSYPSEQRKKVDFAAWLAALKQAKELAQMVAILKQVQPDYQLPNAINLANDPWQQSSFSFNSDQTKYDLAAAIDANGQHIVSIHLQTNEYGESPELFWLGILQVEQGQGQLIAAYQRFDYVCGWSVEEHAQNLITASDPIILKSMVTNSCGTYVDVAETRLACFLMDQRLRCISGGQTSETVVDRTHPENNE